jgi:hypothetical protein
MTCGPTFHYQWHLGLAVPHGQIVLKQML